MAQQEYRHELLPAQWQVHLSKAYEILVYGGRGGGKTRVTALKAWQHATIPGNLVLMCRKNRSDLRDTVLRTLLKPVGKLPPIIPPGTYTHNKNESRITIKGGGEIIYKGFDDEEGFGSYEPGCITIHEARELTRAEQYLMLLGSLRCPADPNPQMIVETNPAPKSHFLYEHFQPEHPEKRAPGREVFFANTEDNAGNLPPQYMEALRNLPPYYRKRFYEGRWGAFEGLVYSNFMQERHVVERAPAEMVRFLAGADQGFSNAFSFGVFGEDAEGALHEFGEVYESSLLAKDKVRRALDLARRFGRLDAMYYDPSAPGLAAEFKDADIHCIAANNAIDDGIMKVQSRLTVNPALKPPRPMLTFSPSCVKTIAEIEGYVFDKNDRPATKQSDHAMDMLRYVVATIDKVPVRFHFGDSSDYEKAARGIAHGFLDDDDLAELMDPAKEDERRREMIEGDRGWR